MLRIANDHPLGLLGYVFSKDMRRAKEIAERLEVGTTMNGAPSILVVHNAASNAIMKNVHGSFKGLLLADKIEHVNAGTEILGMIQAWGQFGNVFGNGTSTIKFSSEVLANLPAVAVNQLYVRRSYREVVR